MALFAIGDLHLPLGVDKPMSVFGGKWDNYVEKIADNWQSLVRQRDTVVLVGDFSWATYLEQSYKDFEFLNRLNGKKIMVKGNHDYWWSTLNKLKKFIADSGFSDIDFLQNNHFAYGDTAICGTRGWMYPKWDGASAEDERIFAREVLRLGLSLKSAENAREIYVFSHFPPMSVQREENAFTELMEAGNVSKCVYGHLHAHAHRNAVNAVVRNIEYMLVSGDYTEFNPVKISD